MYCLATNMKRSHTAALLTPLTVPWKGLFWETLFHSKSQSKCLFLTLPLYPKFKQLGGHEGGCFQVLMSTYGTPSHGGFIRFQALSSQEKLVIRKFIMQHLFVLHPLNEQDEKIRINTGQAITEGTSTEATKWTSKSRQMWAVLSTRPWKLVTAGNWGIQFILLGGPNRLWYTEKPLLANTIQKQLLFSSQTSLKSVQTHCNIYAIALCHVDALPSASQIADLALWENTEHSEVSVARALVISQFQKSTWCLQDCQ